MPGLANTAQQMMNFAALNPWDGSQLIKPFRRTLARGLVLQFTIHKQTRAHRAAIARQLVAPSPIEQAIVTQVFKIPAAATRTATQRGDTYIVTWEWQPSDEVAEQEFAYVQAMRTHTLHE